MNIMFKKVLSPSCLHSVRLCPLHAFGWDSSANKRQSPAWSTALRAIRPMGLSADTQRRKKEEEDKKKSSWHSKPLLSNGAKRFGRKKKNLGLTAVLLFRGDRDPQKRCSRSAQSSGSPFIWFLLQAPAAACGSCWTAPCTEPLCPRGCRCCRAWCQTQTGCRECGSPWSSAWTPLAGSSSHWLSHRGSTPPGNKNHSPEAHHSAITMQRTTHVPLSASLF